MGGFELPDRSRRYAVLLRVSSIADPRIRKFEDPGSAVWLSPVWIVKHTPVARATGPRGVGSKSVYVNINMFRVDSKHLNLV